VPELQLSGPIMDRRRTGRSGRTTRRSRALHLSPTCRDGGVLSPPAHGAAPDDQRVLNPEKYYLPYRVECWLSVGANPIRQNAQPEAMSRVPEDPFVLTIAFHMDEVSILSDVLLPEHSALERFRVAAFYPQHQSMDDEVCGLKMIQFRQPVPTLFNTKNADEIFTELAERLGSSTAREAL